MSKKIEIKTEEPVNLMREWKLKHWEKRIANYNKKENMEPGKINGFEHLLFLKHPLFQKTYLDF